MPISWELNPRRFRQRIKPGTDTFCGTEVDYAIGGPTGSPKQHIRQASKVSGSGYVDVERCWDYKNPGPPYKTGKSFDLWKAKTPFFDVQDLSKRIEHFQATGGKVSYYDGGFVPTSFGPDSPSSTTRSTIGQSGTYSGSFGDAGMYGAAGWNKARPKIEKADASVFTGEFREVPGMFMNSARSFRDIFKGMGGSMNTPTLNPKGVANEFLNQQFGWAPFVNDLGKFYDTFVNTDKYLKQLQRDNGQFIKRSCTVTEQENVTYSSTDYTPSVFPSLNGLFYKYRTFEGVMTNGFTHYITVKKTRAWFEGVFRYYIPYFDMRNEQYLGQIGHLRRLLALYGARVSPSTVWNLTPWSWAIDWVSSIGDSLDNLSSMAYDGLAAKYAFVMRETVEVRYNNTTLFARDGDRHFTWQQDIEVKRREAASPFGFGLEWDNFTPRQIAIVAALGISRA